MNSVLEDSQEVSAEDSGELKVHVFKKNNSEDIVKCFYSATDNDNVLKDIKIKADGKKFAYLTVPSDSIAEGMTSQLEIKNDSVTVEATESPAFITFTDVPMEIVNGRNSMIRPECISLDREKTGEICDLSSAPKDSTLNQFYRMFDEPDTMPDPIYGDTKNIKTPETNVNKSGITSYVFFDKKYILNGFAVYDTYGTGNISVYNADTDELLWSSNLGSYMCRSITLKEDSAPVDCLKIVKQGGDMNELTFYGYSVPEKNDWDICNDGELDIFDLILMKQAVIAGEKYTVADLVGLSRFIHEQ